MLNVNDIHLKFSKLNKSFDLREKTDLEWRKSQLSKLKECLIENQESFQKALHDDLGQTKFLSKIEFNMCLNEIDYMLSNLSKLAKPKERSVPLLLIPSSAKIIPEPYGTVLIIAPWNYPFQLALLPLIGAIAAGNNICLKPSEVSPNVSAWLAKYLSRYLDSENIMVIEGGVSETTELLKLRWDYIFYTGNSTVGKIVLKAASEHLTPVTLELGGKSPVIVDSECNLKVACKRLVFAKFLNAGQTCVAPDHVYVHHSIKNAFLKEIINTINNFYGTDPSSSKDYSSIVTGHHVSRLAKLLQNQKIIHGGQYDEGLRYFAPTIVDEPNEFSPIMTDEIFGPILPVISYSNIKDVIHRIKKREKPLALYIYTNNSYFSEYVINNTSSGSVAVNDSLVQATCQDLPFGGVGGSGMGKYYGHESFLTFSHHKSVILRPQYGDIYLKYPPHSDFAISAISHIQRPPLSPFKFKVLLTSIFFLGLSLVGYTKSKL